MTGGRGSVKSNHSIIRGKDNDEISDGQGLKARGYKLKRQCLYIESTFCAFDTFLYFCGQ